MGWMRHHAIVVTSWEDEWLEEAHREARAIFGAQVTNITLPAVNGYRSFLVPPDGSKEGWEESDAGDKRRERFVAWLSAATYEDGSTSLKWVEVQYGDDGNDTRIVHDSEEKAREVEGHHKADRRQEGEE